MTDLQKENFTERLKECIDHKDYSITSFALQLGHNGGTTLANAVSGRTWPKVVLLLELFNRYPEFNLDWILTGRGNMLIDADQTVNSQSFSNKNTSETDNKYIVKALERAESEIETLKKNQALLEAEIVRLKGGSSPVATGT